MRLTICALTLLTFGYEFKRKEDSVDTFELPDRAEVRRYITEDCG